MNLSMHPSLIIGPLRHPIAYIGFGVNNKLEPWKKDLVEFIKSIMEAAEMTVKIPEYEVLLSYPQREEGKRNCVSLHKGSDELWRSAEVEEILAPSQNNSLVFNPFMYVLFKNRFD